jgi:Arc/MetJ-type ribon-helix-helix transcriptional regulator
MADATLTVSLPAAAGKHVDERVAAGDHATADESVRALIDDDMRRRADDEFAARLLDGIDSGSAVPADWIGIRDAAYRLARAENSARA